MKKPVSEAVRRKMSESRKGKKHSPETIEKLRAAKRGDKNPNYGKPRSEETRRKISESNTGRLGTMTGKKHSEETIRKISVAHKGTKCGPMPPEHREKIRLAHVGNHGGEKTNFWKGGLFQNKEYQRARVAVHKARCRALEVGAAGTFTVEEWLEKKVQCGNACPACGVKETEATLTVDHIIPLAKGGTNWIWNIQPLCKRCNSRKNDNIPKQLSLISTDREDRCSS